MPRRTWTVWCEWAARLRSASPAAAPAASMRIRALNEYLYDEQGFTGNRDRYDDPRNSFLNEVLERRTGIPIALAIVYLEVARRAGVRVAGINFPGHFLLRAPGEGPSPDGATSSSSIRSTAGRCSRKPTAASCCAQHVGDEAAFDRSLLEPTTRHHIIVRMLVNLKRLYVRMRSFPQARFISDLLLTVDPSAHHRAPRSRPARLPPAGFRRRPARPGRVPAPLSATRADRRRKTTTPTQAESGRPPSSGST